MDSRLLDQDLYAVLGVSKDADAKTIKSAYRKLARTHHPDKNSSASSEDKFKAASAAYEILSDEGKRKEYDEGRALLATGRSSRQQPGGMEWDLEDLLNAFNQTGGGFTSARANQPTRGRNVEADLEVSVEDILQGRTLTLTMRGAGAAEEVKVRMDPTTVNGDRVTVRGKGEEGTQGRGDLLLKVHIKDGPAWQLDGTSLEQDLEVDYTTAVLGGTVTVHTPRGQSMTLKVKAGTKDGRKLRISGEGLGRSGSRGDARWRIRIKVPSSINEQAKKALLDYQQALEGNPQ